MTFYSDYYYDLNCRSSGRGSQEEVLEKRFSARGSLREVLGKRCLGKRCLGKRFSGGGSREEVLGKSFFREEVVYPWWTGMELLSTTIHSSDFIEEKEDLQQHDMGAWVGGFLIYRW